MDAETFKKVFLPYHQKLYRIAYRIVQDLAGAEDAVQDTYIKLWNKRMEMSDIDNFEAFAIITLRNTCLDSIRREKHNVHTTYDAETPETISLQDRVELKDELNRVKHLMGKLPEQQRRVMRLKHWDGYSDEEIEQVTGFNSGHIRVLISRARKTLREQFIKTGER